MDSSQHPLKYKKDSMDVPQHSLKYKKDSMDVPQHPLKYKKVLLKLSGEILAGDEHYGINTIAIKSLAKQIVSVHKLGVEISIVIGGGNIIRGATMANEGMDRVTADYMGMMGTIINGLALQNVLEGENVVTRLQTAIEVKSVAEPFIRRKAIRHLEKARILILSGGTGSPYFTTDTTAALRSVELQTDVILKGTKVNGIYDSDPHKNPQAKRFRSISFKSALQKELKIMDSTAFTLCMDNNMPIVVFKITDEGNLKKIIFGENIGSIISKDSEDNYYE